MALFTRSVGFQSSGLAYPTNLDGSYPSQQTPSLTMTAYSAHYFATLHQPGADDHEPHLLWLTHTLLCKRGYVSFTPFDKLPYRLRPHPLIFLLSLPDIPPAACQLAVGTCNHHAWLQVLLICTVYCPLHPQIHSNFHQVIRRQQQILTHSNQPPHRAPAGGLLGVLPH